MCWLCLSKIGATHENLSNIDPTKYCGTLGCTCSWKYACSNCQKVILDTLIIREICQNHGPIRWFVEKLCKMCAAPNS